MLIISKKQEEVLYHGFFETWMIEHLNKFFPKRCEKMGKREVREEIRYGIKKARTYGIKEGQALCLFIDVMMMLGCEFDKNPDFPWAISILNDETIQDPKTRMKRLDTAAEEYLAKRKLSHK
jgi:hypothetical protein